MKKAGRVVAACGDDIGGRAGFARAAGSALRPAAGGGGPEGKLRGRPPPPRLSRSGPWRRTGS